MKFYDKRGDPHNSMMGAMTANVINMMTGVGNQCKYDTTPNHVTVISEVSKGEDRAEPLSDAEIEGIVNGVMSSLQDPLRDLREGKLNSDLGTEMFFKTLITSILYGSVNTSLEDVSSITRKLAPRITAEISILGVKNKFDSEE